MFKEINILETFLGNPGEEFHLRELARLHKVSPATVKAKLREFVKKGVVREEAIRNNLVYRADNGNEEFRAMKIQHNLAKLRESGLIDFLKAELYEPAIILFGSYARGEDSRSSDIDIFLLTPAKKQLNLEKYKAKLGREINLFAMDKKEFNRLKEKSKELANNILNGIKLHGYIEVFA